MFGGACRPQHAGMTSKQNAATVLDMLDAAWNRGDISAVEQAVAIGHIEHEPDGDEVGRGHVTQAILAYRADHRDMDQFRRPRPATAARRDPSAGSSELAGGISGH
jgi:hypothetical protein